MKFCKIFSILVFVALSAVSCQNSKETYSRKVTQNETSQFTNDIKTYYFKVLDSAAFYIQQIDTLHSLKENKRSFLESRKWYKRAEPLLIAYDYENYLSLNAPNLLKIEMEDYTEIKKTKPKSYQVLEEYLFGEDTIDAKELHRVYSYLKARIPFIRKNHILIRQKDRHHLKMIRDAIVTIATKGITGFDSPMLVNSLDEAIYNYETLQKVIDIYKQAFKDASLYNDWKEEIQNTIAYLKVGDFETFDRYEFIKKHTNSQLELVNRTVTDWDISLSTSRTLNPKVTNLFAANFFNKKMFAPPHAPEITTENIALGKSLFNDKTLSKTGTVSCATCHIKEKAFTDGFAKAVGSNGKKLERNSPTLSYALFQKKFFYDGRSGDLEGQIVNVTNNENEFHIDLNDMSERVKNNKEYKTRFDSIYDGKLTDFTIRNAIANYIRSLAPFNSKFDKNMQGLENTLTLDEKEGFNLFMGKAACATCHFPPTFNGTVPPKFNETEFENLGITKNVDFKNPVLDEDPGLYHPFKVEEKRGFFKTSTVRNVSKTAPYMHNGTFASLEEVLDFYNFGGGAGMGLDVPYQTLPSDSLHLNTKEKAAIIAFIKTLTDTDYIGN